MKTYQFYFQGVVEVEASDENEALEIALDNLVKADIGYYEVNESDPDHADLTTF